jgi:hypothetical protein
MSSVRHPAPFGTRRLFLVIAWRRAADMRKRRREIDDFRTQLQWRPDSKILLMRGWPRLKRRIQHESPSLVESLMDQDN